MTFHPKAMTCIVCVGAATVLLLMDKDGWGWFILLAFLVSA